MLCMLLFLYGEWKLTDCNLATPSAARLLLYSYVQRNVNVQDNITQYLERMWFDYCSVHVSTVISHVFQQFRFLIHHTSLVVRVATSAFGEFVITTINTSSQSTTTSSCRSVWR
ncbi:hydroxyacylglutathione hydrolase, partial [Trichinella spiralis]|uniref:hydroxyacylglutathione hydrolase n=1 Tax=Trichinella spiralis TaxID=6334 RepID=UPI0001EFC7E1